MSEPYSPLFDNDEPLILSSDTVRTVAKDLLSEYSGANIHDHQAMVQAATAFGTILRSLTAALDAERGDAR